MSHRCLPIPPDPCLRSGLECLKPESLLDLDGVMANVQSELSDKMIGQVTQVVEALITRFGAMTARRVEKIDEMATIGSLISEATTCMLDGGIPCPPIGALTGMMQARKDELLRQKARLDEILNAVFGIPEQIAKFGAVLAEMMCFRENADTVRGVITDILTPPIPPIPPIPPCPPIPTPPAPPIPPPF